MGAFTSPATPPPPEKKGQITKTMLYEIIMVKQLVSIFKEMMLLLHMACYWYWKDRSRLACTHHGVMGILPVMVTCLALPCIVH